MGSNPENNRNTPAPPELAVKVLELVVPSPIRQHLVGDLWEEFTDKAESEEGKTSASIWFWKQAVVQALFWVFRGNLVALACALSFVFHGVVACSYLAMSTHEQWLHLSNIQSWNLILLASLGAAVVNNLSTLREFYSYVFNDGRRLVLSSLETLSQLVKLLNRSIVVMCALSVTFIVTGNIQPGAGSWSHLLSEPSTGLAWILCMHTFALSALLSFLEESLNGDLEVVKAKCVRS